MSQPEIEAALDAAFKQCEAFSCPLSQQQKQILLQAMQDMAQERLSENGKTIEDSDSRNGHEPTQTNPLDELSSAERQTLLQFISQEESENRVWKTTLLNDWIEGKDSGSVQFIRDRYGLQWLEQVKPSHLASYGAATWNESLQLKVGDRIEVTNGLWEWVQDDGPCSREWFSCTVIEIRESAPDGGETHSEEISSPENEASLQSKASCIVRFDTGAEYEIQGVYDWNRPNWRWVQD